MSKQRMAILGGGMAGLTVAYELSRTPELRAQYDITVYQSGWRLGGKCASGRDDQMRNLEHGLHVWFGYYENAFGLLREVYDAYVPDPVSPVKSVADAFKPQVHTGIGVQMDDGAWAVVSVDWPKMPGAPGEGTKPIPPIMEALVLLIDFVRQLLQHPSVTHANQPIALDDPQHPVRAALAAAPAEVLSNLDIDAALQLSIRQALALAHAQASWLARLEGIAAGAVIDGVAVLISAAEVALREITGKTDDPTEKLILETLNVFAATMRGVAHDLLIPNEPFESIDNIDFRAWLLKHGGDPHIVATSALVRILYDISFQYTDGDLSKPDCAAGSGLGSVVRIISTYQGDFLNLVQGGFGEIIVSPLRSVLLARGVKFELFRKVTRIELTPDKQLVGKIHMGVQVDLATGVDAYTPTFKHMGLECWPVQPFWDQLKDGAKLKEAGVNFESHWCQQPFAREETLTLGTDFDHVVLAIAMGAYKPLTDSKGHTDPGFAVELAAANPRFAEFLTIPLNPSFALQLWSDWTLEQLGWTSGKTAVVSGPEPLDIWADMSQVIAVEGGNGPGQPKTLHYLCGAYATKLYAESPDRADVPSIAFKEVRQISVDWLNTGASAFWPGARLNGGFDWNAVTAAPGAVGEARFDNQFWRANIDPTETCVACAVGTTLKRLLPDQSGFANLTLTGEGTRHGLNATAVEAAVMSGRKAAQAICGQPVDIPGFDFLMRNPFG